MRSPSRVLSSAEAPWSSEMCTNARGRSVSAKLALILASLAQDISTAFLDLERTSCPILMTQSSYRELFLEPGLVPPGPSSLQSLVSSSRESSSSPWKSMSPIFECKNRLKCSRTISSSVLNAETPEVVDRISWRMRNASDAACESSSTM